MAIFARTVRGVSANILSCAFEHTCMSGVYLNPNPCTKIAFLRTEINFGPVCITDVALHATVLGRHTYDFIYDKTNTCYTCMSKPICF